MREVCVECPIREVCESVVDFLDRDEPFDFDKSQKDIFWRDRDAIIRCMNLNPEDCVVMKVGKRILARDIIKGYYKYNRENVARNLN